MTGEVAAAPAPPPDGIRLSESWKRWLRAEFDRDYMRALRQFLGEQKRQRKVIYPRGEDIFAALDLTPFEQVKVVVIGQDPYHGPGQAHGLCFSVLPGVPPPPSLQNVFREIVADLAVPPERAAALQDGRGCLRPWARQGVLLLNAVLTVERGRANSHQDRGWEAFTDRIVELLNREREGLVFMLWGSYAQRKGAIVDTARHLVLRAPHPSPLSASRGFLGCRHFSRANRYLVARGLHAIDWLDVE